MRGTKAILQQQVQSAKCQVPTAKVLPSDMADQTRIAALRQILDANPNDAFARYALALEYSNSGDMEEALGEFERLLAANPDYTNGYFMAAQTLMRADRAADARNMLRDGIECARRTRNQHAMAEMEGMLDEIGRE